ncbi:hypothetical protein A4S06_03745 [Erysipelotrichaceae bacterium MTC7]|nr:hypothetical protein A4S06_03745 [Erysipelotrichaceae bacterium MTC7]
MNYTNVINEVMKQTGKDKEICTNIADAYEEYCTEEVKRPFKPKVDAEMVAWVANKTGHANDDVANILQVLVSVVRGGIRKKIPFMKS